MFPDLLSATRDYWQKLDELEAAYKRDEVTLKEVDERVEQLIAELGRERRIALRAFFTSLGRVWNQQKEAIVGVSFLAILTYAWAVAS